LTEAARLTFVLIARIPPAGVGDFGTYEANVLPLLAAHGGLLERHLRNADGTLEVHIVSFPDEPAFERYRADPRRVGHAPILERSKATMELLRLRDVAI
jgi:hypothetical protein